MASKIKIFNRPFFSQEVILGETSYVLTLKFNTSDEAWYLSISYPEGTQLLNGIKLMPNQNLTGAFSYLERLTGGDLWCVRLKNDRSPLGRDNLGIGKTYELVWISSQEAVQEQIDGITQL